MRTQALHSRPLLPAPAEYSLLVILAGAILPLGVIAFKATERRRGRLGTIGQC